MSERLTKWEGSGQDGPRAVFAKEGQFPELLQEVLKKLAKYEDQEIEEQEERLNADR